MRIAVLGSGAMGSMYGGLLTEADEDVWLLDVWQEHIEQMRSGGLRLEGPGIDRVVRVQATTDARTIGTVDLVMVFVKSMHTADAVRGALDLIGKDTSFLTLQNGLGNYETLSEILGPDRVVAGVTYRGAKVLEPGHVYNTGSGETVIGELDGRATQRLERIAEAFNRAGLVTRISSNVVETIWRKVTVNVCVSAMAAVTGLKTRELVEVPPAAKLMRLLLDEAVGIARASGVVLSSDELYCNAVAVFRAQGENKASMLVDIEEGRKTEVDAISGAVVRQAQRLGMAAPYNEAMTLLVKALEARVPGGHTQE